MGLVWTNDPVS